MNAYILRLYIMIEIEDHNNNSDVNWDQLSEKAGELNPGNILELELLRYFMNIISLFDLNYT